MKAKKHIITSYHDSAYPALAIVYGEGVESDHARNDAWERVTPLIYRSTAAGQLPCPEATMKALSIDPDSAGVILFGGTGEGKTRTGFLVARKMMDFADSNDFAFITGRELRDRITSLSRTGGVTDWVRELVRDNGVIFIDDVGHGSASDSYLGGVLELVEAATTDHCRLVITANFSGRELLKHWARTAPDARATAEAIVRRLGEFCVPVRFTPAAAPKLSAPISTQ